MAAQARDFGRRRRARVTVLGPVELRRRGMGGVLAVGGGSANTPRVVRIELGRGPRTVALVGKGVTFDTGGISIKPAAQMDEMKWDKCGACAVLGMLEAAARLALPVRIRAYVPLAENMPDGAAYRPGDIVRCANGKTVEILNTDAEGRMILADALAWAASEKPDTILEYSTLTGACVVALGPTGAGLFTPDDGLADGLLAAAEDAGERLWRLPLWEEFLDEMRGAHADLKNSGGRWGGASTAAAFLSQFVAPVASWAHLDVAGPAYVGEGREKRGATGYGVALTIGWLLASARRGGRR
jgi:leucyl aminopeptidase